MILGLTGGICTGKSVASAVLEGRGVRVVDADEISRYITAYDPGILEQIRAAFGAECFHAAGALNRQHLADVVFGSEEHRIILESILHPPIIAIVEMNIAAAKGLVQHLVVTAPLLIEAGMQARVDHLWVVSCRSELQAQRLRQRLGISEKEAMKWISAQMPLKQKETYADTVLHNDGTIDEFQHLVEQEWNKLVANT